MKNKDLVILIILIISGSFMILMTMISYFQDLAVNKLVGGFNKNVYQFSPDKINLYNIHINKFNYWHGLFMIPTGIFIVMLLIWLDIPPPIEAIKKFKKDLTKKIKKDKERFKKRGL